MSEQTNVEEATWPTHCALCGTELKAGVIDVIPGGDEEVTTVIAKEYCPNPDCPGKDSDLAPIAEGEAEKWLNRPGTEGGANGGA